ncbi:MAG: NAD(P)-dependent oxidoreductase [Sphingomonadales bacterium]
MALNVAFLGLGVMGYPMAGHLARAGHRVTVYNRTPERARKWLDEYGAAGTGGHNLVGSPMEAVDGVGLAFACLGADKDLEAVFTGPVGALEGLGKGSVFIDHTTVSATITRRFSGLAAERGVGYLDAPVSGGEAGAVNGQLTVMVGGSDGHYARAEPLIDVYAKKVALMGPVGAGQTTKMVNQICIAGVVQGLAEAVHFAIEAGLDADQVMEVISKGAAQSWQMENRWQTMAAGEFDFGFAVNWMRKDLAIVLDEARQLGLSLPLTALVDQFYGDVQKMGGSRQDTSSLIRRFRG